MPRNFAVIGAGNIGTVLARDLAKHRRPVRLLCIEPEVTVDINSNHQNTKYLPGIALPRNIQAVAEYEAALAETEIVLFAVPSPALEECAEQAAPFLGAAKAIGCITKGLDEDTLAPVSLKVRLALPPKLRKNFCLLGGPAIANEIADGKTSALVVAGEKTPAVLLAEVLQDEHLKVGTSRDLMGVGYAMALKNSYAIALGLCQGLKLTMNTQALAMTLALQEMAAFLKSVGAEPLTAYQLPGLGDLIVTGFSEHSRNRTYGERLVGARSSDPKHLGLTTVEGIATTKVALKLAAKKRLKTPLLEAVQACMDSRMHFERPMQKFFDHLTLN